MQPSPLRGVLGTLRRLAGAGDANDLSDADLLERFRAQHEEAAFTLLVQRHGPMVLAVCRRVLGDRHEAEDAFQATFLVLVLPEAVEGESNAMGKVLVLFDSASGNTAKMAGLVAEGAGSILGGPSLESSSGVAICTPPFSSRNEGLSHWGPREPGDTGLINLRVTSRPRLRRNFSCPSLAGSFCQERSAL